MDATNDTLNAPGDLAAPAGSALSSISVTERAFDQVDKILANEPDGTVLRVSVSGGGCSGFQYGFELTTERLDGDLVFQRDKTVVVIDDVSVMYLADSEIDYVDDLIGASFQIRNPHATASCGCGTSFSL